MACGFVKRRRRRLTHPCPLAFDEIKLLQQEETTDSQTTMPRVVDVRRYQEGEVVMKSMYGREGELEAWREALLDEYGQAMLVIGQQGMGKTMLLAEMVRMAFNSTQLRCGAMIIPVVSEDTVANVFDAILETMLRAAREDIEIKT